jgi:hypothetical protein
MSRQRHKHLREAAHLLHTKPGVLAGWLLELGGGRSIDMKAATLQGLLVTANEVQQLTQRFLSWWRALQKARLQFAEDKPEAGRVASLLGMVGPPLKRSLVSLELCQGVAAANAKDLPLDLQQDIAAANATLHEVLSFPDGDNARAIAEYLIALGILHVPRTK